VGRDDTAEAKGGEGPVAGLAADGKGNLYGTTSRGGDFRGGEVFVFTPKGNGEWTHTVLHDFGKGTEVLIPMRTWFWTRLAIFYGTTCGGGTYGERTVFEIIS